MIRITTLAVLAALASPVHATDVLQQENGNAVNTCTPALTQYDTGLRRRPLAIVNEGTAGSFVNCAFRAPTNSYGQEDFAVRLRSYRTAAVTVTCTGVIGVEDSVNYIARNVVVPANGSALVKWAYVSDNAGNRWQTNTSLQCFLPPLVGMTELPQTFRER